MNPLCWGERTVMGAVTQRENERDRVVAVGKHTDDGAKCTLLAVREAGGDWCLYPHGAGQLVVRLPRDEAVQVARAILDCAR